MRVGRGVKGGEDGGGEGVRGERVGDERGGERKRGEEVEGIVPYLLRIMEADLAYSHAAVFLQVRPRGVDHGDVVALVAYERSGPD